MKFIGLQQQISKNQTRTKILLSLFPIYVFTCSILFSILSWQIGSVFIFYGIAVSLFFVLVLFIAINKSKSRLEKKVKNIEVIENFKDLKFNRIIENLCLELGIKVPEIKIIDSNTINSAGFDISKKEQYLYFTKGVINKCTEEEQRCIIGYNLIQLKNSDFKYLVYAISYCELYVGLAKMAVSLLTEGLKSLVKIILPTGIAGFIIVWIVFQDQELQDLISVLIVTFFVFCLLVALGFVLNRVVKSIISRKRVLLNDALVVELTKDSLAYLRTLNKIKNDKEQPSNFINNEIGSLFIKNSKKNNNFDLINSHPDILNRINLIKRV